MADKIVKLKDGNDYLYPYSVLNGVDTSNLIYSNMSTKQTINYTATEDCHVFATIQSSGAEVYIDSVKLGLYAATSDGAAITNLFHTPLKKGQNIIIQGGGGSWGTTIYGIKR